MLGLFSGGENGGGGGDGGYGNGGLDLNQSGADLMLKI